MRLRAVIFDVYRTILRVVPAPGDAASRWPRIWEAHLGGQPRIDHARFTASCEAVIAREHAAARGRGVPYPEVYWPDVVAEVVPEIRWVAGATRRSFERAVVEVDRRTQLMPGSGPVLRLLLTAGMPLGIASNAQPYTLQELHGALVEIGLGMAAFRGELTFWSFEHGFSKPDPHVFQILGARLRARGIAPGETLMVGDRLDNDIAPASTFGWQTFHIRGEDPVEKELGPGGDWLALARWLDGRIGV